MMDFNACSTEVNSKFGKYIDLLVIVFRIEFSIFVTFPHSFISNDDCLCLYISRPCLTLFPDNSQECAALLSFPVLVGVQQALIKLLTLVQAICRRQNQRFDNPTIFLNNICLFACIINFNILTSKSNTNIYIKYTVYKDFYFK